MKKQHVVALVFLVLALGISLTVFLVARGEERARRARALEEWARRNPSSDPLHAIPPSAQNPRGPEPPRPAAVPAENIQQTLKTIEELQRINRMNEELRRRQQQTSPRPSTPEKR